MAGLLGLGFVVGCMTKKEPMIKAAASRQVEGQLLGYFDFSWWKVLVQKFLGGCLSILGGLSLGREGPSILLGACCGKGAAQLQGRNRTEEKYLITCGAWRRPGRRFQRAAGRRIVCLGGGAPQL